MKLKKMMIVDDSKMDTFLLRHILKNMEHEGEICSYENPAEAIDHIRNLIVHKNFDNLPCLIFLDLHMPEMSGFNFLDVFSSFPEKAISNCKIIITSSEDDIESIQKSASYKNVIDFIIKPVHNLEQEVQELLDKH